jgi:hypothetical protein
MRWLYALYLVALLAIGAPALAPATELWTNWGTITSVEVVETGGFLVTLSGGVPATCTAANAVYIYAGQHNVTADGQKALLATALSAFAVGNTVRILYDDSTPNCFGRYLTVTP